MKNGFTLLEMIVAISIFSIVVGAMVSVFMSGIQGQRNAIAQQNLVENIRFAFDQMTRQIRMATRDDVGACLGEGTAGSTFVSTGSSLTFLDSRNPPRCVTYALVGGKIMMQTDPVEGFLDLTSDDIVVGDFQFVLAGEVKSDGEQPRVTIFIGATSAGGNPQSAPTLQIQTTISGRNLDVL